MADRRVTRTRKDKDGEIIALCHPGAHWSPRYKPAAIWEIENGRHNYYVNEAEHRTDVGVVDDPDGKQLRATADESSPNRLDNLPDCLIGGTVHEMDPAEAERVWGC